MLDKLSAQGDGLPYTKLDAALIHSTVWREPNATRIVWITMLAMKDRHGEIFASIPGLADAARVTLAECETALATFLAPDTYSRNTARNGRRIEPVPGGWIILNHDLYRAKDDGDDKRRKAAARQQRYRERHDKPGEASQSVTERYVTSPSVTGVTVTQKSRQADADADADTELTTKTSRVTRNWLAPFCELWSATYGDGSGHSVAGRIAKAIRPLVTKHGSDAVLLQLRNYLKQTPVDFATPSGFAAKFGAWTGSRTTGTDGKSKQERGRDAMRATLQRREAQEHGNATNRDEISGAVPRALPDPRNR